jgi:DNA polymerase-3 subunit alpha
MKTKKDNMSNINNYTIFHCHSSFSLLDGYGSPKENVKRAKELGMTALGVSDHGNSFSHIQHHSACKKAGIKALLGVELYVYHKPCYIRDNSNRSNCHMVIWAKNRKGWDKLNNLVSYSNEPELYYYKPRVSLWNSIRPEDNKEFYGLEHFLDGNIMGFSGHQGSHLSDILFCDLFSEDIDKRKSDIKKAYGQYKETDIDFYKQFLRKDWLNHTSELALKLENMFGKGNFFIELQNELNPKDKLPLNIHPLIVNCLREVSENTGIPAVASSDPHYPRIEDAQHQRTMVMINLKETEESVSKMLDNEENDTMVFFGSNSFYIHSYEEMSKKFTKEELELTNKIADQVESFDIAQKPIIPCFNIDVKLDNNYNGICKTEEDKYILQLCIEGAKEKKLWESSGISKEKYWDRLKTELEVLSKAGLSPYFLIVWDYCMAAKYRPKDHSFDWKANLNASGELDPIPTGTSRGSAGGCLISCLMGITDKLVDPLKYDLMFGRFYNDARNTKDNVEMPDIDIDFASEGREWIVEYLKWKYGKENVGHIITFHRIQGRAAIKDVFRVKGMEGGFDLANKLSQFIPNEAEIADEIQEMKESGVEDYGILQWAIDNSKEIKEAYENKDLTEAFDQAIKLEGKQRAKGKHPSGIIVTDRPISECFPMSFDSKSKEKVIGIDYKDVATCGGVKLDILATSVLDKLQLVENLVNKRKL